MGSFSGGTQTITVALRYVHLANAYISQGSHACNYVEAIANQVTGAFPGRQLFRVIGALDSHAYLYSRIVFGFWNVAPSGFYSPFVIAPIGATLTRNISGVVSVTVSDPGRILSGDDPIVTGCSDSTFNGVFNPVSDTGTVFSWQTSTLSVATTTCTNSVEILSRRSGTGARQAQEFPGAEIVNTNDPVTFAINYNISVEPNTNFQVTAGDHLEAHVYHDVVMGLDHNLMEFTTQNSPSVSSLIHFDQIGKDIPEGTTWYRVAFTDDPIHYQGKGGTKPILNTLYDFGLTTTPFSSLFAFLPPPKSQAFSFNGCLYGCSDSRSQFQLFFIPTVGGTNSYTETIHQDTGLMETNTHSATNSFTRQESPAGLSIISSDGAGNGTVFFSAPAETQNKIVGPSSIISIVDQTAIQWSTSVSDGTNTSHFIQVPTAFSMDKPLTVPGVTVTGTGHFIATGTASNTDLTGELAFSAATTATYTWAGTYVSHPEVNITPQMDIGSGNRCWVSYTGVTSFTINCASAVTGAITYGPIGRN